MKKRVQDIVVHGTIFDDVFRTMVQKIPRLMIPLINEMFHTNYDEDIPITQLRNEYEEAFGKIITDSIFVIKSKTYHIECQSYDDATMAIRMIEYDFSIALEQATKNGRTYEINFPETGVLYLRDTKNTPDILEVKVNFPNGTSNYYTAKTLKASNYTADEIFQKRLFCLLPYFLLKYENQREMLASERNALESMLKELENIRVRLEEALVAEDRTDIYSDLIGLMLRISNHIFRNEENVKEGVDATMGGKVLKLLSEELREQGMKKMLINLIRRKVDDNKTLDEIAKDLYEDKSVLEPLFNLIQNNPTKTTEELLAICNSEEYQNN